MRTLISSVALAAVVAAGTLSLTAPASAAEIYSLPNGTPNDQNWSGSLGLDFTVNSDVVVYGLGAFYDGSDSTIDVALYNTSGLQLAFAAINTTSSPYTFQGVPAFILTPGTYQVTAWGYGTGNGNYNTGTCGDPANCPALNFNPLGTALTFGAPWYNDPGVTGFADDHLDNFNSPNGPPQGPYHYYGAGNFEAYAGSEIISAAPLPATWTMLIAGFIGLGFFAYRGSKKSAAVVAAA
jgi:hypothetical protein